MNKTKKIAIAAVSLAMAGTMALGVFGCNNNKGNNNTNNGGGGGISSSVDLSGFGDVNKIGTGSDETVVATNQDKSINYDSYNRTANVTLNMACGHDSNMTSMTFKTLSNGIVLPDGKTYQNNSLKPAWQQVSDDLNIGFKDVYLGKKTDANFKAMIDAASTSESNYANVDVFTSDLSKVVEQVAAGKSVLNLGDYLDKMPHFKKFLEENPVVYLSLLQDGMDTSTGAGKKLYVAPYFDGYDDIERYYLIREDWAKKVLNGDTELDTELPAGANTTVAVEAEFTANYTIDSLTANGQGTQKITKDYAAAKTAVNGTGALHDAYVAIAGSGATFAGENGNIITIMNDAMTKGAANVTADKLADLYRAYIDVAYKVGSNAAYTASTRANLFNGYDAAWDVDDLVAMLRIMTRAPQALLGSQTGKVEGIVAREKNNDRSPDVLRLITGLYGVRGADSRFEYSYIDANGDYQDARLDADFYNAILNGNKLYQEGLIAANYYNPNGKDFKGTVSAQGTAEGFMMYDYVQTQTGVKGFDLETTAAEDQTDWMKNYYLGAIINPVAKWSVSAQDDTTMRFTESWRSTKTGGLALNGSLASNPSKLLAALQFIDYLYSEDGKIVSTFGPKADNANGDNGFWYNTQATQAQIDAGKYFTYKGVKYAGTDYKGDTTPTITEDLYDSFLGKQTKETSGDPVGKLNLDNSGGKKTAAKSFTNYARMLIGSTLPMCIKNQSFEYQCTAKMGKDSAYIVGVAIDKGILNHVTPLIKVDGNTLKGLVKVNGSYVEKNSWYIMVPSGLPTNALTQKNILDAESQLNFKQSTGTKPADSIVKKANYWSFFHVMIANGFTQDYNISNVGEIKLTENNTVAALVTHLETVQGGTVRENTYKQSWNKAKDYAKFLFKAN